MYRLILAALLCLPLSMFAQEANEKLLRHELGINLNATENFGTSAQLTYKYSLSPTNALRFSIGANNAYINTYSGSLGFRRGLYKNKKFEITTGADLSYQELKYGRYNEFGRRFRRDVKSLYLDIPLELNYEIANKFFITGGASFGINLYDNRFALGSSAGTQIKVNFGISKRF